MAGEWRWATIGALCDAGVVHLQTGPFGSQLHASDYVLNGVPVVPTEAIRGRRIDRTLLPMVSQRKADQLARHRLCPGDILFARRGVQATGHIGWVRAAEAGFLCGTGAIRLRVADPGDVIDADFLSHALADPASIDWFKFHAIGATMPNLNEGIIRSFPLCIPPMSEQRRIAHILGTLDDKIELNRRMCETLEAMARALFKSWFVDFDPVRAKAEGRATGLPKEIADLFPDRFGESELGEIPEGWDRVPFACTVEVLGGGTPRTSEPSYWGAETPWFSVVDAPRAADVWVVDTEKKITQLGLDRSSATILPVGTTILTARGTVGRTALVGTPMAMNQSCYGLRGRAGARGFYTYFTTRHIAALLQQRAHGSVFDTITRDTLESIPVPVPPAEVVDAFEARVGSACDRIQACRRGTYALTSVRSELLPRLVSGELRADGGGPLPAAST